MELQLDLRGVMCPMNFVKTKLFMDKMEPGQVLSLLIDGGEPVESVSSSVAAEGHQILECLPDPSGHFCLSIRKV